MIRNIRVEFKINEPVRDSKGQENNKTANVRAILKARLSKLQDASQQGLLESVTFVRHERDEFDGRERWKIYLEGNGGLELFETSLHNEVAKVLSDKDELLVSVVEAN